MSWIAYTLIFGVMGLLSASVIYGLYWALKGGQMSNFAQGATSIFDDEEPQGETTDSFPKKETKREDAKSRRKEG